MVHPLREVSGPDDAGGAGDAGATSSGRDGILRAAASLLRRKGYAATGLREIAAAVGMKAGSLYHHFESKEAMAEAVLRIGVERVHAAVAGEIAALDACRPVEERIGVALRAHLATLLLESDFTSAHIRCFHEVPDTLKRRLRSARRDYEGLWIELIDEAGQAGLLAAGADARDVRRALLGALNWSLEWFRPGKDDPDAYARTVQASFFRT